MRKFRRLFLSFALICLAAMAAHSQSGAIPDSSLSWAFSNGVLTISGSGDMPGNWIMSHNRPWQNNVGNITSIVINDGVTNIGDRAFSNHASVTSLTIANTVTRIGNEAFYRCSRLGSVAIPPSVIEIAYRAFYETGLTSIVIPDTVKTLGIGVFSGCTQLTSAHIGSGLTVLPDWAFGYTGLTEITIPEGISRVGGNTFSNSRILATVYFNAVNADGYTSYVNQNPFWDCPALTTVIFGDRVQQIPEHLFTSHTSITSVTIGSSVTRIHRYAFHGCTGIREIVIPDSVNRVDAHAFAGCTGITSITLGSGLNRIEDAAFYNTSITSLTIPERVTTLLGAFSYSSKLETVYWNAVNYGDMISTNYHFDNCPFLTNVIIGDNVRRIPNHAFSGIASLENVTIGSRVTAIGNAAFEKCTGLFEITNKAARPQALHHTVFNRVDTSYVTLIVPAASVNAYSNAEGWKDFVIEGM